MFGARSTIPSSWSFARTPCPGRFSAAQSHRATPGRANLNGDAKQLMATTHPTEKQIPLALIFGSAVLLCAAGLVYGGLAGFMAVFNALAIATAVGVLLMLLAAFLTAGLFSVSFGEFGSAVLKLTAIYISAAALAALIPTVGGLLGSALAFVLLMWLFELEMVYAIVFAVMLWLVQIAAAALTTGLIA